MSFNRSTLARVLVAISLLLLAPLAAQAQNILGALQGTINDSDGGALPGVTIEVRNTETGLVRTVFTDAAGFYKARKLPAGTYDVTASLEGFQTTRQSGVSLLVAQELEVDIQLGVESVSEVITVTSEAPLVETGRTSAAAYISQEEVEALPISGRDFKEFAFLAPTVQNDPVRGFITMSGQLGIYSGLNIDGTSAKSAFFGYGRGGEATENDGLVVAQDSVREFQVITNGFSPEYGANAGGYINVVTKSGTNTLRGTGFYFFRDDELAEDIPGSPLDEARGRDGSREVDEFERENYGISLGGPILQDKTHFFVSIDQTERTEPITRNLDTPGIFDLIMERAAADPRFLPLLDGYDRNPDGSATGLFNRDVDNQILFGKLDHQFSPAVSGNIRFNITDFERISSFRDEESEKFEETTSIVGSLVALIGDSAVNEFRIQSASDELDRLSARVGEEIEAQIRFRFGDFDSVGKFDFLPIFVEEDKLQVQNNFSYLFGTHDLKFGIDYQEDDLSQLFAGSRDGRYDFQSAEDFLNNNASNARIYFGNVQFPNYDETQTLLGLYAQDAWQVNDNLTVNYGVRYGRTDNPGNLEHLFPEGREIPDDDNNWAPRLGFAYSPGESGRDVFRGGIGLFYGRTPSLLFASQVQQNGLFPNFGRVNVGPGDVGFVPLGEVINNQNPPDGAPNSPSFVDPSFEDAETLRVNLGYEREFGSGWVGGIDAVYAEGENLQSNIERNRTYTFDEFGRPIASGTRPDPNFNEIFVRESIGESEYTALTFKINKRFNGRYQLQAHYTWSEDEDTDSNERSATSVTVSNPFDVNFDLGLSDRDVEHRFLLSGLVEVGWGIKLSGIFEFRSGTPFTAHDSANDFFYCGGSSLGFNCPDTRAVVNGQVVPRNGERNEDITRLDLRVTKAFDFGDWTLDVFGEVFNVFDENFFAVETGFAGINRRDPSDPEFGIPDDLITTPRQVQLGFRISFR
ncbi:MAG: TonB-dependent receptor [Acidobacteriota bacterium]